MSVPISLRAQARTAIHRSLDHFLDVFDLQLPVCLIWELASHNWYDRVAPAERDYWYCRAKHGCKYEFPTDICINRRLGPRDDIRTLLRQQPLFSVGIHEAIQCFINAIYSRLYGNRWSMVDEYIVTNLDSLDIPLFLRVDKETLLHEWFAVKVRDFEVKLCFRCASRLYRSRSSHAITFRGVKELHDNAFTLMQSIGKRDNWCCECGVVPLFWIDTVRHRNYVGCTVTFVDFSFEGCSIEYNTEVNETWIDTPRHRGHVDRTAGLFNVSFDDCNIAFATGVNRTYKRWYEDITEEADNNYIDRDFERLGGFIRVEQSGQLIVTVEYFSRHSDIVIFTCQDQNKEEPDKVTVSHIKWSS